MPLKSPANTVAMSLDPIRKSWFEAIFTNPNGDRMPGDNIFIRTIPELRDSIQSNIKLARNSYAAIPGLKENVGAIPMSFRLYHDIRVFNWWQEWRGKVYDTRSDFVGLYNKVIGNGNLVLYGPAKNTGESCGRPIPLMQLDLIDVWPSSVVISDVSMDNEGEQVDFTVNLEISEIRQSNVGQNENVAIRRDSVQNLINQSAGLA